MAWNAVWSQSEISINDVKYLLADICNAINERLDIINEAEIDWITFTGTSQSPAASDFVGMEVMDQTDSWYEVCQQIDSAINTLFPTNTIWWKSSSFAAQYTRAEILTAIGYVEADIDASAWRTKNFYLAVKAMMPYARYYTENTIPSADPNIFYHSDPNDTDAQTAWDNATTSTGTGPQSITGGIEYELFASEFSAGKTSDTIEYTLTIPSRLSPATFIKSKIRIEAYSTKAPTSDGSRMNPIDLDFILDGNTVNIPLSTIDYLDQYLSSIIDSNNLTIELSVDMDTLPFSISSPNLGDTAGFVVSLFSPVALCYDLSPAYTYP
jgi:hypothetical protein